MDNSVVIIPAYKPNDGLLNIVNEVIDSGLELLVVNDGSGSQYDSLFADIKRSGAVVITHDINRGKGRALKTAFEYVVDNMPGFGAVTADADGQHHVSDILKLSKELRIEPESYIFGERDFSGNDVPFRSRLGNWFASFFFRLNNGFECKDTQTGLRAYPAKYLKEFINVDGERYEYEMNTLSYAVNNGIKIKMVDIETVYSEDNISHFRAVRDSMIIFRTPLKFLCTSLTGAVIDLTLFTIMCYIVLDDIVSSKAAILLFATVSARIVSGLCNFLLNKYWCFNSRKRVGTSLLKYGLLFGCIMLSSWGLVYLLTMCIHNATAAKMCVDSVLFIASYYIQKRWVF